MKPSHSQVMHMSMYVLALSIALAGGQEVLRAEEARDQLPLGHPAFYPSPERPLGWRGDGNGAFPGASIGVDKFSDGPVKIVNYEYTDKRGKQKAEKWPTIDQAGDPVNIVWKFPLPGFTQSQPLVLGHKAIITCEPRTILCIDMNTGNELWRQELCPFRMLGLQGEERERALALESAAWTMSALSYAKFGNYTRLHAKDPAVYLRICALVRTIVEPVADQYPTEVKGVLDGIEKTEAFLKSVSELDPKNKEHANAVIGGIKGNTKSSGASTFLRLFQEKYKFCANQHWYSYVGWTWPTPVTDGTWLYIFMGQGQLARIAVADGAIGWFRKYGDIAQKNQPIPRSPLLHDGVFIVPADDVLYGIEAETGKELWRFDVPSSHNNSGVGPTLMHLKSGRTVLASPDANNKGKHGKRSHAAIWLHDIKTGKVLAEYNHKRGHHDPGPSLMAEGNFLYSGFSGLALEVVEAGEELSFKEAWTAEKRMHGGNTEVLFEGNVYDSDARRGQYVTALRTGERKYLGKGTGFYLGKWKPGIMAGDRMFGLDTYGRKVVFLDGYYRQSAGFTISSIDGSAVSKGNLLETASDAKEGWPHVVPQAARYLGDMITGQDIISQCAGIPSDYSYGSLYAHGNRLLIPSIAHLYCVGDPAVPFNGKPAPIP